MKERGIYLLITSLVVASWSLLEFRSVVNAARKSPFFSEFGSVAWPAPLHIRLLGVFGALGTLAALLLGAYDFKRQRKQGQ
jgi:hypothetical protein